MQENCGSSKYVSVFVQGEVPRPAPPSLAQAGTLVGNVTLQVRAQALAGAGVTARCSAQPPDWGPVTCRLYRQWPELTASGKRMTLLTRYGSWKTLWFVTWPRETEGDSLFPVYSIIHAIVTIMTLWGCLSPTLYFTSRDLSGWC